MIEYTDDLNSFELGCVEDLNGTPHLGLGGGDRTYDEDNEVGEERQ
ncbi:hypothetical protein [Devosia sp. RR2S18]|nr:hypothetical protein [Devosia sp. RR2S18]WIJ26758.1 hypothetical protein QOV41_08405 [Devosia sp. RR2S18]